MKAGFLTGTEPGSIAGRVSPPAIEEIAPLFPQLEIQSLKGQGGMGAVYRARQVALDRLVALKILSPAVANDPGFAERFNREAQALAQLNHPNIVAVHDFGKSGSLHFLIMEYVDGPNLREIERTERLLPEQALGIVPQICEALQFAHNQGIVHRDIKPENILLDSKGRVKITDFGIAKIMGVDAGQATLTGKKDVIGTPHYMAPEQVEKPNSVDHRADIYSLGVVFYELLTGELPLGKFQPPSTKATMDKRLDEVVLRTLEKEPERRYQHVHEVKTQVEAIATSTNPSLQSRQNKSKCIRRVQDPLAYGTFGLASLGSSVWILLFALKIKAPHRIGWWILGTSLVGMICAIYTRKHRWGRWAVAIHVLNLACIGLLAFNEQNTKIRRQRPSVVIAQTIQHEVGRQLREHGASYSELHVTVGIQRDQATPFKVSYRGLINFKGIHNTPPDADGNFMMEYIGSGQWMGVLAGEPLRVQVGSQDKIDLPFVPDPHLVGKWDSVDFIADPSGYRPSRPFWKQDLFLKDLTFLEGGLTPKPGLTWTKGTVMHRGDHTASHYEIREFEGQPYLFFEWKSGDVTISGMKPQYYVLKKRQ